MGRGPLSSSDDALMRVTVPGQIDEDLYLLGDSQVPVYLVAIEANRWALIEGGVSARADAVWRDLVQVVGDPGCVEEWLITHKHYDHCGLLPYLAPRLPNVRIRAPQATVAAWAKPKARQVIATLNEQVGRVPAPFAALTDWPALRVEAVNPGEALDIGTCHRFQVLAAPGHADDQVVYYDARAERLFAADALGEFDDVDGLWRPLVFDDYAGYLATLMQLESLPVRQLLPGHGGLFTGEIARTAAADARSECIRLERRLHWRLHGGADPEQFAAELHEAWRERSADFVPTNLHLASMRRMLGLMAQPGREDAYSRKLCS